MTDSGFHKVAVAPLPEYDARMARTALENILSEFGGMESLVSRSDKVLLKPNMLSAKHPEAAVTTHPVIVEAVAAMLRDYGCTVLIGDSPGIGGMGKVAEVSGIRKAAERSGAIITPFDDTVELDGGIFKKLRIARAYCEADAVINLPKLKTHEMMTMTCAVKNLFGIVVGAEKAAWHLTAGTSKEQFARLLIEIAGIRPPVFSIVDAVTAMEGNGPGSGDPVNTGKLVGGRNIFAVDVVAARIAGLPENLLWIEREAALMGVPGSRAEEVMLIGDAWSNLCGRPFRLPSGLDVRFGLPRFLAEMLKQQLSARPVAGMDRCTACGVCRDACPPAVITITGKRLTIDYNRCIRCWCCRELCPYGAMDTEEGMLLKIAKGIRPLLRRTG